MTLSASANYATCTIDPDALKVLPGRPYPLGVSIPEGGVRFAVFSRHAERVWLALFRNATDPEPAVEFEFNPREHRMGDVWSIFVQGLASGALYAYRMDGPHDPETGHRYDASRYLLDPYAKLVVGNVPEGQGKGVALDESDIWLEDRRPHVRARDVVIYETHVRGMTVDPSAGAVHPGTYRALQEKIPYLKDLGVTMIELLPVQEVGEDDLGRCSVETKCHLRNYWGYNSIAFFSPAGRYACNPERGQQVEEFRAMVRAMHDAGIEVTLDVVFNHTAEGNENGPTLSFRGIDNSIYYLLDEFGHYRNYSGCGNTMNCNHPLVRDFIMDCLRYWVAVMHIDGFRFDLASILGRNRDGHIMENPPLIEQIAEDPVLRGTRLIAEAWDAGGAYQVGSFGDVRWAEWNGRYRDDVRRFWRGELGMKGAFATRVTGSSDLYQHAGRTPMHSINFITAHDGFTLRDLVSYSEKHNVANGEDNRDGCNDNLSWNCGVEGATTNPVVQELRARMQRNYLATLFLSLGVPMLLGGDEFGRTQQGNNNAYCQDNPISWYDWNLLEANADLHRFCRGCIRFRRENPVFRRYTYFDGLPKHPGGFADIQWYDARGNAQTWEHARPRLAYRIDGAENEGATLYLAFNPTRDPAAFRLPAGRWAERINTGQPSPRDLVDAGEQPEIVSEKRRLKPRSMAVFVQVK